MILCLKNEPKEIIAFLKKHGYTLKRGYFNKAGHCDLFVIDKAHKYGRDLVIADLQRVKQDYLDRLTDLVETKTIINCFFQFQNQSIEFIEYCINETKAVINLIEQNFEIEKTYKEFSDYRQALKQ